MIGAIVIIAGLIYSVTPHSQKQQKTAFCFNHPYHDNCLKVQNVQEKMQQMQKD